ncbi:MAG TPA: HNH endonuclease, partial [Candidatus Caenarcaniphilales bacterium]
RAGFADEVEPDPSFPEGAVRQVTVNQYERSKKARDACLREHGADCSACGINFEQLYGEIGRGFIHVHHTRPLSRVKGTYQVDPKKDLVPVCPNCHAMLHRREPAFDVEQLRSEMRAAAERLTEV